MRAATGPLKTGTYIAEPIETSGISLGEFVALNKDRSKFTLTKNVSEAVKVRYLIKIRVITHLR
jgi:hypothetical protein